MSSKPKRKLPKKKLSRTTRAGLVLPVGRIHRFMRKANLSEHIGGDAAVFMAASLEFLLAEILVASSDVCEEMKKKRITPRHIQLAIQGREDLSDFLKNVTIPSGGAVPFIEPELIPKQKPSKITKRRLSVDY